MSDLIRLHAKFLTGEITKEQYEELENCKICEDGEWYECDCQEGENE